MNGTDDTRPEYDLKALRVRRVGAERMKRGDHFAQVAEQSDQKQPVLLDADVWNDNETVLIRELVQLDVPFLASADVLEPAESIHPITLLCGLARSDAARVRMALIPLFLKRPEFAQFVTAADAQLAGDDQTTLRCYYTAAHLLQQENHAELDALFSDVAQLPPLFFCDALDGRPIEKLHQIHVDRTGQAINWLGTYNHAFQKWMRYERKRVQWHTL